MSDIHVALARLQVRIWLVTGGAEEGNPVGVPPGNVVLDILPVLGP
jgi:hypothetical protein